MNAMKELTLSELSMTGHGEIFHNLSVPQLVTHALLRDEGKLTSTGALDIMTGKYTGRSPKDKFIVDVPSVHDEIEWGEINRPISKEHFRHIKCKMHAYLQNKPLFVFDGYAGVEKASHVGFRVINEYAYQNLFVRQLLIAPNEEKLASFEPDYTIICAPGFSCIPEFDGVNSETAIVIDFESRTILIGGNLYCGEIKKSVFTVMNYELPRRGILTMHCSANTDEDDNTALFFGLSGTGKTTLSSSSDRRLIGDDEHGWSDTGVFNIEGGCYAKCIGLDRSQEPEIHDAIRFGALLENVVMGRDGVPDFSDSTVTVNTRAAYPLSHISNASATMCAGAPKTIIFLTADAFGVLPPIARLDPEDAIFHYLSGYTSKVSGTECGITRPVAAFSAMFGAPFFPLRTEVYTKLFREKLSRGDVRVFLVNTGWCGGYAGEVPRIKLSLTRSLVKAAIGGALDDAEYDRDELFRLNVPRSCPGIPDGVLSPQTYWADSDRYQRERAHLAALFEQSRK